MRLTKKAYAKINLTLDCTGKRSDGYHLLRSVMQSISLFDTVTIERSGSHGIFAKCGNIQIENNIAVKAANAFFDYADICISDRNINILIDKNIPVSAGLGGGSTDAAAVIILLDRMFKTELKKHELINIAENVGADVPFCLFGGTALVEGIGECISPLPDFPECFLVLTKPLEKGSTGEMYCKLDRLEKTDTGATDRIISALNRGECPFVFDNAFLPLWPDSVYKFIKSMSDEFGSKGTSLTGSGPTFFSAFTDQNAAKDCFYKLSENFSDVFLAKTVNTL